MDLFTIGLLVITIVWSRSILFPPPKKTEKKVEEELGEAVGNILNDEKFGKTLGKYLKETAKEKEDGVVNINIHLNRPGD